MKGYIFALAGADGWERYARLGLFGTREKPVHPDREPRPRWATTLAAFADYATIEPGDRIFFFSRRIIYGIGRAVELTPGSGVVFNNYVASLDPEAAPRPAAEMAIIDPQIRVVVPFVPDPQFYSMGLDMDEVLASPEAENAWGLRFWAGASFKQLGEIETRMLMHAFERRFSNLPGGPGSYLVDGQSSDDLRSSLGHLNPESFSMHSLVRTSPDRYVEGLRIRQEETLHGLLAEALRSPTLANGAWYRDDRLDVYHELPASPPKPAGREDSIDVLATRRYQGPSLDPMAVHFEVIEAKADRWDNISYSEALTQLMKYVDFVSRFHAGGNYGAISARYVARRYRSIDLAEHERARANNGIPIVRTYVLNPRESPPTITWSNVELWTYAWADETLVLDRID